MSITFNGDDTEDVDHHDSLVISLYISNFFRKRVLVDNGSSSNIIFKDALDEMGLKDTDILKVP